MNRCYLRNTIDKTVEAESYALFWSNLVDITNENQWPIFYWMLNMVSAWGAD